MRGSGLVSPLPGSLITRRSAVAFALALPAAGKARAGLPKLRGPVDVAHRRTLIGQAKPFGGCSAAPEPQRDVQLNDVYVDPAYSIVDPALLKRYQESAQAFGAFSVTIARQADAWVDSQPSQPAAASCLIQWLDRWAGGGAMLGKVSPPNGEHERKWALAGAAQAYLKVRDAPGLDPAAKLRIEKWFAALAAASRAYYAQWRATSVNNHIFWLNLAVIATAVANDDRALFEVALQAYRTALDQIQPDGTLPLEMARKQRALNYHIFALIPLVMIAEFGAANGVDLYAEKDGALHRLARRVQDGMLDPSWFAERAGVAQEENAATQQRNISWAEPYYARFPNPTLGGMIVANRPIFYHWLGGNVTNDFGSPALPLQ